jgi:hypothetical protein
MGGIRRIAALLSVLIVVTGLTWATLGATSGTASTAREDARRAPAPRGEPTHVSADQVAQAVRSVAPGAAIGLEVYDRDEPGPVLESDPDRQFPSASVVKLLIALDALNRSGAAPPQDLRDQVQQMLSNSDDNIASALWEANGGPAIVTRTASLLGLTGTQPPDDPAQWGNTAITAGDIVTAYRYIADKLPDPERSLILDALTNAHQQAADGTNQYFGISDGLPGVHRAIKQGWMNDSDATILHTTGLVGDHSRYVVVLLTSTPTDSSSSPTQAITTGAAALAPVVQHKG